MHRTAVLFPLFLSLVFIGLCVWVLSRLQPILLGASMAEQSTSSVTLDSEALPAAYDQANALSPVFTPEVHHWAQEITDWSEAFQLDPNLVALVMQIESCGHPDAVSHAGAMGLFQVMPFHFSATENPLDPHVNASRGLAYFARSLELAEGKIDLALAGYNGGHGVIHRHPSSWPAETQRYVRWGSGIYQDLAKEQFASPTLEAWLKAGGSSLCDRAASSLALP
jgi:soluble lytic murein transglycosylase-like protein